MPTPRANLGCPANALLRDVDTAPVLRRHGVIDRRLLNDFQRDFPLRPDPFAVLAAELEVSEESVLEMLSGYQQAGLVSRVGPVFSPNRVGRSTLAAMAVPAIRLEAVADLVSGYAEVNHNYERSHRFNLWFVVTAADEHSLQTVLEDIEQRSGLPVMSLPMLESYHLDLGFHLDWGDAHGNEQRRERVVEPVSEPATTEQPLSGARAQALVAAVQDGLPLVSRPYRAIADTIGASEEEVVATLRTWVESKVINRFGVVLRHRKLGYRANAMVVWNVPDEHVSAIGECFGKFDFVTLCYRRPRRLPDWPYNLFCMIHGQDREAVMQRVQSLAGECGSLSLGHETLFSLRCFKQRGAVYHPAGRDTEPTTAG